MARLIQEIVPTAPVEMVTIRITEMGDGQVSSGEFVHAKGDLMLEHDEKIQVPRDVADALRKRGFAELVRAPKAPVEPA